MDAVATTPPSSTAPVADPPFELDQLHWSMDGLVARTDNLAVARQAQAKILEGRRLLIGCDDLGDGVYQFTYAFVDIGEFVFGTQHYPHNKLTLYYFAFNAESLPRFALVASDGVTEHVVDSSKAAEALNEEQDTDYAVLPYLG